MNSDILLWYNAILGEYFSGSVSSYKAESDQYQEENLNILYTMDSNSAAVINKIRMSLNSARGLQGDSIQKSA
ncbi:MAG: hypothetical protein WBA74_20380 [Cyclobacteriaceae bacterium]